MFVGVSSVEPQMTAWTAMTEGLPGDTLRVSGGLAVAAEQWQQKLCTLRYTSVWSDVFSGRRLRPEAEERA
jgi:hypothetical protein